jgi:hypothetical protein
MKGNENLQSLVSGGLIGAGIGALLANDKEEGTVIGALLGAVFAATLNANKEAHKTKQPIYEAMDGKLYQVNPDGERIFIKDLPRASKVWSDSFILE